MKFYSMFLTFPTFLTLVRLALIPLIIFALIHNEIYGAVILLLLAVLSDLLDGYLARKWHQESFLGACLDPLADKILMISCYGTLVVIPLTEGILPSWFLVVVLIKEALLLLGAGYFGLIKRSVPVRPLVLGKLSMAAQSIFVIWLLFCLSFGWQSLLLSPVFIGVIVLLLVGSFLQYSLQLFRKQL